MTNINLAREDEKATKILRAIRQIDDGAELEPVVRCGACRDWLEIEETGGAGYCNHPHWMIVDAEPPIVQFCDFCSYGERRTDV